MKSAILIFFFYFLATALCQAPSQLTLPPLLYPNTTIETRAKAHGIAQYGPPQGGYVSAGGVGGPVYAPISSASSFAYDFNPLLIGGQRGLPGVKARINQRGFQYFSALIAPILDQEIQRARIPPINQCPPIIPGCIRVYNIYVSRYRCPQRVAIYPAPCNQIVIAVQNFDIGLTGNLGGELNIIIPIQLFGIVQINAHQVSVYVQLTIVRGPTGAPSVQVAGCSASVGYLDVYVQNGGFIGDIANSPILRPYIIQQVRDMLPTQICGQIPNLVNSKINSQLGNLPQAIPLSQILQFAGGALGLGGGNSGVGGGGGCGGGAPSGGYALPPSSPCHAAQKTPTVSKPLPLPSSGLVANNQTYITGKPLLPLSSTIKPFTTTARPSQVLDRQSSKSTKNHKKIKQSGSGYRQTATSTSTAKQTASTTTPATTTTPSVASIHKAKGIPHAQSPYVFVVRHDSNATTGTQRRVARSVIPPRAKAIPIKDSVASVTPVLAKGVATPTKSKSIKSKHASSPKVTAVVAKGVATQSFAGSQGGFGGGFAQQQQSSNVPALQFIEPGEPSPCGGCPGVNDRQDPASLIQELVRYLDFSKLNDIYLSVQLLNTYATLNDYTIELNGEFSQGGQGCTPFGPFPMSFPCCTGNKMAEALISDFTLNSLFYSLHRKGFLSARLGPETPKIGPLLKTTCSHDDGGSDQGYKKTKKLHRHVRSVAAVAAAARGAPTATTYSTGSQPQQYQQQPGQSQSQQQPFFGGQQQQQQQSQSQGGISGLGSFEICFGDLFPAIGQRYPNRNLYIQIHTTRAPSIILSARNGGSATIDLIADADIYTDSNEKVGTIRIEGALDIQIQTTGGYLRGNAQILNLRISNPDQSLGIPQETLDTFGVLGRELIGRGLNDFLHKGIPLQIPSGTGGLPINFIAPEFQIVEHGIYLQSDFTISPSFIAQLSGSGGGSCGGGGGGNCGSVCRR